MLYTYTEWTAFPTLASTRLPRLYDVRSRVRRALTSIGNVLAAKITVEVIPASTGRLVVAMPER
jgi:hypothetical protein